MGKFLFVMTRGLEDPTRVTRALQLAKVAKEQDHDVNIFLTDDAVVIAKPGMVDQVKAPTGDEAKPYLQFLIEKEVPIYVWIPCAKNRQVGESDVVKTAQFAGAPKLISMSEGATVFTFWGFHIYNPVWTSDLTLTLHKIRVQNGIDWVSKGRLRFFKDESVLNIRWGLENGQPFLDGLI